MSELLHKIIKRTDLKPEPWHRNNGWYGHIVYFEDETKGEIFQCTEANPSWLKAGETLVHITRPNKYPDKPFLVTMDAIEKEKVDEQQETSSSYSQSNSVNRFKRKENSGGTWKGFGGRYEDSPDIWLKKQKFISILKFYEVLMPLVIKGDIKYEAIQEEVSKHLKYTMREAGMNEAVLAPTVQAHIPSHASIQKPAVKNTSKSAPAPAKRDTINDRVVHTNREVQPDPEINPDLYSSESPSTLFDEDTSLKNEPAPADILKKISECSKKSQLTSIHRSLTPDQLNNKNIMNAFFAQKNKLGKKK